MESGEQHHHYWPGECTIPLTPQALRYGFKFKVYCTHAVWGDAVTWTTHKKHKEVSSETRIYDLLHACYSGLQSKLATADDFVYFEFKHWCLNRHRPEAKKKRKMILGARLFLDPDNNEPWLLIFEPGIDALEEVANRGEPKEHPDFDGRAEEASDSDNAGLDIGEEAV